MVVEAEREVVHKAHAKPRLVSGVLEPSFAVPVAKETNECGDCEVVAYGIADAWLGTDAKAIPCCAVVGVYIAELERGFPKEVEPVA